VYTAIFMLAASTASYSQVDQEFEDKMNLVGQKNDYSWAQKNLFVDWKLSFFSEYLIIPTKRYKFIKGNDEVNYVDKGVRFSVATLTIEPRVNLLNFSNNAITLKVPASFGLSFMPETASPRLKKFDALHVTAPFLLGFARNLNATYSNASRRGFGISGGVQFMKTSIIGGAFDEYAAGYYVSATPIEFRSKWITPLFQFDYYRLNKKNQVRNYTFSINPIEPIYLKISMGANFTKK
jgi:hypothetical protein